METIHQIISDKAIVLNGEQKEEGHFVPRNRLSDYLLGVRKEDIPWAVNFLVNQLTIANEPAKPQKEHAWESYKLSEEMERLSSFDREKLPADYDDALKEALEEKYR